MEFYNSSGELIEVGYLFRYAYYAIKCYTDSEYRKFVSIEEDIEDMEREDAHEEFSIAKKILRKLKKTFTVEQIEEMYMMVWEQL